MFNWLAGDKMKYLLILGLLFVPCTSEGATKEELLTKIKELEKIVTSMDNSGGGRWQAKEGAIYYEIESNGVSRNTVNHAYDRVNFKAGNMFKDKATAQHYAKKRAARQRLELLALALNGGGVGFKSFANKYILIGRRGKISVYAISNVNSGEVLFKTGELAKRAIKLTSKEDLTTMFGSKK